MKQRGNAYGFRAVCGRRPPSSTASSDRRRIPTFDGATLRLVAVLTLLTFDAVAVAQSAERRANVSLDNVGTPSVNHLPAVSTTTASRTTAPPPTTSTPPPPSRDVMTSTPFQATSVSVTSSPSFFFGRSTETTTATGVDSSRKPTITTMTTTTTKNDLTSTADSATSLTAGGMQG